MSQERDPRHPAAIGEAPGTGRDATRMAKASLAGETADIPSENLTIFSAPAVEVVFQWWLESNRRWAARSGLKAPAA